ncbi:RPM1 interacting protein 13 [Nymphaea colorata]|nr:RPM1 interacting protein 13 [Nymphaea colorata]
MLSSFSSARMPTDALTVIDVFSSSDDEGSPPRHARRRPCEDTTGRKKNAVVLIKKEKEDLLDDDCYILDVDPYAMEFSRKVSLADAEDVAVIAEKGPVAARDFPHSRHLCVKFPFATTPHETHCQQCYCYVCEQIAPCSEWKKAESSRSHCNATDKEYYWTRVRMLHKPAKPDTAVMVAAASQAAKVA